ncbi:BTB/POZ and TAZ domain-containing protein 2 [Spatholobus suberectus]|nr:BTB/POZ and TAZ domain-containing protein 2 [Spatholobus suberectus]
MVPQLMQRYIKGLTQCLITENVVDGLQLARLCDALNGSSSRRRWQPRDGSSLSNTSPGSSSTFSASSTNMKP